MIPTAPYDDILRFFKRHWKFVSETGVLKPYEFERMLAGEPEAILGGTTLRLRGFIEGFNARGSK